MWCFSTLYSSLKEHLSDSFIGSLEEVKIPDTIIFDEDHAPIAWYYSPKEASGVLQKKSKDVIRAKIFRSLVENSDFVIVANVLWYDQNELGGKTPQIRIRYLDEHELRQLLLGSDSAGKSLEKLDNLPPIGTKWILQKFVAVDARGLASTICSECIGGQRFSIKRITNNHYFHGHSRKHDACLTIESYDIKHVREERISDQVMKSCSDISEIVQQCLLKDSISTSSINLYFSQDKIGRIWLKWALYESNSAPSIYISENSSTMLDAEVHHEVDSKASFLINKSLADALCSTYEKVFGIKKTHCYKANLQSMEYTDPFVIDLLYDAKAITYEELLDIFWNKIVDQAFNRDAAAIYYYEDSQKTAAESSAWRTASTHKCMLNVAIESSSSLPSGLHEIKVTKQEIDGIAFQKSQGHTSIQQIEHMKDPSLEINNDAEQSNEMMSGWHGAWQSAMEVDKSYNNNKTATAQVQATSVTSAPVLNPVPPTGTKTSSTTNRPTSAVQRTKISEEPIKMDIPNKGKLDDDNDNKSVEKDAVKSKRYEQMSKPKLKPALALDRQKVIELNHLDLQKIAINDDPVTAIKSKKKYVPKNKYAKLLRKSKWIAKKRSELKKEIVTPPGWVDNTYVDYKGSNSKAEMVLSEFEDRVKRELDLIHKKEASKNAVRIPTAPPSAPSSRSASAKSFRRPTSGATNDSNLDIEDDDRTVKSKKSVKKYDEIKPAEILEQSKEFGKRIIRQKPIVVLANGKEIFGPKPKPPPLPPPGMPEELVDIVEVIVHNVCANLFSCLDKSKDIAISHREGLKLCEQGLFDGAKKRIDSMTMDKIIDFIENGPKVNSNNPESEYKLPLSDASGKSFIEALQLIYCTPNHRPTSDLITIVMWILSSERDSSSDEKEFANIMKSFTKYTAKAKKLVAEVASICQGRGPTKEKEDKPRWNAAVKLQTWYDRRHAPKEKEEEDNETKANILDELELTGVDFVNSISSPQVSHLTMNSKSQALSIKNGNMSPRSNKVSKDPRNNGSSNITSSLPLSTFQDQDNQTVPSVYQYKYSKVQKQWDDVSSRFREIRKPAAAGVIQKLGNPEDPPSPKKKVLKHEDLNLQVHMGMEAMVLAAKWNKKAIFDNRDESKKNEMLLDDCYEAVSSVSIEGATVHKTSKTQASSNQNSQIITELNSEVMGKYGEIAGTPLNDKSMSSLSNNVMLDEDDDLDMTLSPMSPAGSSMSPPKEKSIATPTKSTHESKSFVEKVSEDKEIMFHRLAPKINSLQRKMFIVSLVSDSARTLILCVLVLIKHTQAGKEVKYEDLLNLFGKPVAKKIGHTNLLALLRWIKANRRSEMNFIPSHERYLEFALQRLFAFWPDTWVNVAEVNPNIDEDTTLQNNHDEYRELSKQLESKITPIETKQMKTTVRLKWPDKFRVTKLFLEPHALEPNLNFI